jgi:glycine hydroxymethyltransferase
LLQSEGDDIALAKALVAESKPEELLTSIEKIVAENDEWRTKKCINLHAAESMLSPRARKLLQSDLDRRVILGDVGHRKSPGGRYLDQLDTIVSELIKKTFGVKFEEHRPVTTSIANGIVLRCLTEVGDTILALQAPNGHPTWRSEGYAGFRGLKVVDIPFDYDEWNIDVEKFREVTRSLDAKPKLVVIGTATFLFPYPVAEIVDIADELGAKVWYDGAHVLGLIAGGRFQQPFDEGAYLMTGTCSKTLSGPMGGIILHNDQDLDLRIRKALPGLLSNIGHERTASLAASLVEMSAYGSEFAGQVVRNAKALAKALDEAGFEVIGRKNGYTESHVVLVDATELGGGERVTRSLEQGNIIASPYPLRSPQMPWPGVRIGVSEVTRLGMKETEMRQVADFARRLAIENVSPDTVKREVTEFREKFDEVHYCL